MSEGLKLGKYEFFPYTGEDGKPLPTVEEPLEFLRTPAKARSINEVEITSRSVKRRQLLRKQSG